MSSSVDSENMIFIRIILDIDIVRRLQNFFVFLKLCCYFKMRSISKRATVGGRTIGLRQGDWGMGTTRPGLKTALYRRRVKNPERAIPWIKYTNYK